VHTEYQADQDQHRPRIDERGEIKVVVSELFAGARNEYTVCDSVWRGSDQDGGQNGDYGAVKTIALTGTVIRRFA